MTLLRPALMLTLFFVVLCGLLFPAVVTGAAQIAFPGQANGSMIRVDGRVVGSELIGQAFGGPTYFHTRPSAAGAGYDAASSSGTNLGPTNPRLLVGVPDDPATTDVDESFAGVKQLAEAYRRMNGVGPDTPLPADAVTRSASGLDPHISIGNARLQAPRVARMRGLSLERVQALVDANTDRALFGVFGEDAVNVLRLNLALDREVASR